MASRAKVISNTVAFRIKHLRQNANMTQKELAQKLFKSESTVRMWELGKSEPDLATINLIAEIFGTTTDYLIDGTGVGSPTKIPVLGKVAAGIPIEAVQDILDYEELSPDMVRDGSEYFALQLKGDSMEPRMHSGDVVIVRKQETIENGEIAIVCVNGDEATCKKVMKKDNGAIILQPLNPTHDPLYFTPDEVSTIPITILGKVVELRAKF